MHRGRDWLRADSIVWDIGFDLWNLRRNAYWHAHRNEHKKEIISTTGERDLDWQVKCNGRTVGVRIIAL